MHTKFTPCDETEAENRFLNCSFKSISKGMLPFINCTIPGTKDILRETNLKECEDEISAANTFNKLLEVQLSFANNPVKHGCLKPCKEIYYEVVEQQYVHKNSWIEPLRTDDKKDEFFIFQMNYKSKQVQEIVTTFQNDLGSLFSAGGGNLGLFLGFSCLSLLLNFVNFIQQCLKSPTSVVKF